MLKKCLFLFCIVLFITGCGERLDLAPVVESHWRDSSRYSRRHVVVRGETLYAIAFRYDLDYRQLAMANRIRSPYTLRVGQIIQLNAVPRRSVRLAQPAKRSYRTFHPSPSRSFFSLPRKSQWLWPAQGRVVDTFVPQDGKKGIDIAGKKGDRIIASSGGVVAYAGNGLSGYGNLIIIRHDNQFLTAYGNNARNLVVEGQSIRAGQVIAEMGVVDHRYWGVHFEIRHAGQPVNPLQYLRR